MGGSEGLSCQVGNHFTELVVTRRYEAALIAVEGMTDAKADSTEVTVAGQVWVLYSALKEYIIPPFLVPKFCYVHHGRCN